MSLLVSDAAADALQRWLAHQKAIKVAPHPRNLFDQVDLALDV